ncbi:hypothetical protein ONE63_001751 [Megalurothrips usitatus]|uniref:Uncharacterized protein n=1 Tax=Megalurothrips usitatus TaxID=439358 RepID=A0AAV7XCF0_9NEOP|nr:hypothetical protein ONE63_001751 [Megalurothrips usitatus]
MLACARHSPVQPAIFKRPHQPPGHRPGHKAGPPPGAGVIVVTSIGVRGGSVTRIKRVPPPPLASCSSTSTTASSCTSASCTSSSSSSSSGSSSPAVSLPKPGKVISVKTASPSDEQVAPRRSSGTRSWRCSVDRPGAAGLSHVHVVVVEAPVVAPVVWISETSRGSKSIPAFVSHDGLL